MPINSRLTLSAPTKPAHLDSHTLNHHTQSLTKQKTTILHKISTCIITTLSENNRDDFCGAPAPPVYPQCGRRRGRVAREGDGTKGSYVLPCCASFRVASCSSWVSISSAGSWTYRTTEPRMKQFFTDSWRGEWEMVSGLDRSNTDRFDARLASIWH